MKVGDLVKWIGYPGQDEALGEQYITGPVVAGIIIAKYKSNTQLFRYDVAWGDGSFGTLLYEQTIEVISASR